jgi:hypothetical protein
MSVDSSANSGTQAFNTEYNTIATALSQGTILGKKILSSSVYVANTNFTPAQEEDHLPVILGVCISLGIISNFNFNI